LLKNSVFILGGRVSARVLGLIGTLVVARMLVPEDYGIIAACVIVQDFAARMQKIGLSQNIISKTYLDKPFLSTAFYLNSTLGLLASFAVYMLSKQAASFLDTPQAGAVLSVICWNFALNGFTNIGLTLEAKKQNFAPEVYALLVSKVVSVIFTVFLAYYLNNYWALAIGMVVSTASFVLLSYVFAQPFIPARPSKDSVSELFGFSRWVFLQQNVDFFNAKMFQVVVAKLFDPTFLGYFSMGANLSNIYSSEVSASVDKSNFSHISEKLKNSKNYGGVIAENLRYVFDLKSIIITPLYLCAAAYSPLVIGLVLGEHWLGMAPFLTAFALSSVAVSFNQSLITLYVSVRLPKFAFYNSLVQLGLRIVVVVIAYYFSSPMMLAYGGLVVNMVSGMFLYSQLYKKLGSTIESSYNWIFIFQLIKIVGSLTIVRLAESDGWTGLALFAVSMFGLFILENLLFRGNAYRDVIAGARDVIKRLPIYKNNFLSK